MNTADPGDAIQEILKLLGQGHTERAAGLLQQLKTADPDNPAIDDLASRIYQHQGNLADMLDSAKQFALTQPENFAARLRLAECLLYCGDVAGALDIIRAIEQSCGDELGALQAIAEFYIHCGQHEAAYQCQVRAMQASPENPELVYNTASSAVALGKLEEAETLYERVIYLNPADYDAWQNRSTLRKQTEDSNHVKQLRFVRERMVVDDPGRIPVCYALAKELEDLGDYSASFQFLREGAEQRRRRLRYNIADDEAALAAIKNSFNSEYISKTSESEVDDQPIFVLGLPRSGTSLVDQIVASHSNVESLGEANTLAFAVMYHAGPHANRDALIKQSAEIDPTALGKHYLSANQGFGIKARHLLDKTPLNFLYLGLLNKALPKARIIHLRRNPVDSCYAIYKTLFRSGYPFSYSLQDVGRYYIAYHQLMNHWRQQLPGYILDVDYESLVTDTEQQVNRILDFLELPFEDNCLEFHQQERVMATASAAQVRQPVYQTSVQRWKCFERELIPLANKLIEHGVDIG